MQSFDVKTMPDAKSDLADIVIYLTSFSESIATKYYGLIGRKILSLKTMPLRYPLVRDERLEKRGTLRTASPTGTRS